MMHNSLVVTNIIHVCPCVCRHMLWFLFTVVEESSTAFEKVDDSRSVHCTASGNTFTPSPSSYKEFRSVNEVVNNDSELELINLTEGLSSNDIMLCAVNISPPSMSMLNIPVLNAYLFMAEL